jgi:hypothetical protein
MGRGQSRRSLEKLGISEEDVASLSERQFERYKAQAVESIESIFAVGLDLVEEIARNGGLPAAPADETGHRSPYQPRSITGRRRRSAGEIGELLGVVRGLLAQQTGPISIRHLFYLVVSAGAFEKTERGYQNLKHQLTKWRRSGAIDSTAFADATRWYYGNPGHRGPRAFLEETIRTYRFNLWEEQDVHVEIWAEKDAIASILLEAADPWRVQVFPFRGFPSLTSLYNAAEIFREKQAEGKTVHVYYFGDRDRYFRTVKENARQTRESISKFIRSEGEKAETHNEGVEPAGCVFGC